MSIRCLLLKLISFHFSERALSESVFLLVIFEEEEEKSIIIMKMHVTQ